MKRFINDNSIGFCFKDYDELSDILYNKNHPKIQNIVKDKRTEYSFDFSVNKLVAILEKYALWQESQQATKVLLQVCGQPESSSLINKLGHYNNKW